MQLHVDHLPVQVARKIEQMRLNGRRTAVHKGRLDTDVGRRNVALASYQHTRCIYTKSEVKRS